MSPLIWMGFLAFIMAMVALDLGVFHRKERETTIRSALAWTSAWITLALIFNVVVYFLYNRGPEGRDAAINFLTGYLLEYSLSVDNIFVIALVITFFRVPPKVQHRLLFWGVLGAVIARGVMIAVGAVLVQRFEWITYVFGLLLIFSAVKMLVTDESNIHPENNLMVRLTRRLYPVSSEYDGSRFFTRVAGVHAMTPLAVAMILITWLDALFAIDSIPAIFAITTDPFLVFTSNIFAILGLRSLYFALAGLMDKFRYLKVSLVFLLAYIGVKMLLHKFFHIDNVVSLAIITGILSVGVLASLWASRYDTKAHAAGLPESQASQDVTDRAMENADQ